MSRLTAHLVLPLAVVSAIAASSCSDATPTGPVQQQSFAADRGSKPQRKPDPPPDAGLTATELLADPLLQLLLTSLHDPIGSGAIIEAIEVTRLSLEDQDIEAARSSLQDAYAAMVSYLSRGVDDEDVIHLDAAERFLDETESLIGSEKLRGKKNN